LYTLCRYMREEKDPAVRLEPWGGRFLRRRGGVDLEVADVLPDVRALQSAQAVQLSVEGELAEKLDAVVAVC
ncbi:hypothetical protein, partial [Enterococcus faecium]|uniref:hypothetical protein n=1 Tax=Enterococcus faecium TaxID=1352 RepID=UPI003CC5BF09